MTDGQDLMRQIASAGERIDPGLSERDVERLVAGARARRRRRQVRRCAAGAVAVTVAVLVLGRLRGPGEPVASRDPGPAARPAPSSQQSPTIRRAPDPAGPSVVRLADGSLATPLEPTAELTLADESAHHVGLALRRGRGRFEVAPNPARTFAVQAGDVTVTAIGTVFTVERIADRVGVAVERGKVRVDWGTGSALLAAGESGWYPPLLVSPPVAAPARVGAVKARAKAPAPEAALASAAGATASAPETAEQLLLAADRERLAGRAGRGAELLRKAVRDHGDDPRAPLAAFTLGRMLLIELGQPREAAAAFAEVRRLSPRGPFAEDALAREIEALSKAGEHLQAHERAQEYLRLYPAGRRTAAVRAMVGE